MLYNLDEICLIPAKTTDIEHRHQVFIYDENNKLPIFTAPMHSVINIENREVFEDADINTIIPRTINWNERYNYIKHGKWTAVGFKEAEYILNNYKELNKYTIKICIDQANGHMSKLLELCLKLKNKFNKINIMTGNIANPNTYELYARYGIDYVRVGIGGGNACTTSVQTGIHFPMGSLLTHILEEKQKVSTNIKLGVKYKSLPKIVADGGISRIDQAVKALALGADYVMLGKVFAQTEEACGDYESYFSTLENKHVTYREYFGMSTEKAQELINKASLFPVENFKPKHTEGQVQTVKISYSLNDWVNDFKHALKSCMSYNNSKKLDQFIGKVRYNTMSISTFNNYMK